MKIAVLYICIGSYDVFWDDFFKSCEQRFYPMVEKHYYVFTDNEKIINTVHDRIFPIYQKSSGWPYNTLLRYQWFCSIQDRIADYDAAYYFNANTTFLDIITSDVIPFPTVERPYVFGVHAPRYDDILGERYAVERNPQSTAYIPYGTPCRENMGGFWGGTGSAIVIMCQQLRNNVLTDLSRGIIAVWHDQSHLQQFATQHEYYCLPKGLANSEEYVGTDKCYIMFMNKEHFGGNDKLRGVPPIKRVQKKIRRGLIAFAIALKIDKPLQKMKRKIRNRKEL